MRKKNVLSMSINLSLNLLQRSCRCHQYHNASYMNVLQIRKRISSISSFPLQYCRVCDSISVILSLPLVLLCIILNADQIKIIVSIFFFPLQYFPRVLHGIPRYSPLCLRWFIFLHFLTQFLRQCIGTAPRCNHVLLQYLLFRL